MPETTTAEISEFELTRLQQRALGVVHTMGCATPPAFLCQLSRAELFRIVDTTSTTTGAR